MDWAFFPPNAEQFELVHFQTIYFFYSVFFLPEMASFELHLAIQNWQTDAIQSLQFFSDDFVNERDFTHLFLKFQRSPGSLRVFPLLMFRFFFSFCTWFNEASLIQWLRPHGQSQCSDEQRFETDFGSDLLRINIVGRIRIGALSQSVSFSPWSKPAASHPSARLRLMSVQSGAWNREKKSVLFGDGG